MFFVENEKALVKLFQFVKTKKNSLSPFLVIWHPLDLPVSKTLVSIEKYWYVIVTTRRFQEIRFTLNTGIVHFIQESRKVLFYYYKITPMSLLTILSVISVTTELCCKVPDGIRVRLKWYSCNNTNLPKQNKYISQKGNGPSTFYKNKQTRNTVFRQNQEFGTNSKKW